MYSNSLNGCGARWARGFVVLFGVLAMGLGLMASPAEAAPFLFVANSGSNNVSVINTATNTVVATIPVGTNPNRLAVTPDGTHV
jgi:YVTN family beta-propeller protein